MHMADALISPAVGGVMGGVTAGLIAWSSSRVTKELPTEKVPLMGVLGAFIFAAQMINFTIPATGSSGHLGGGMILSVLLGPHAAFLTIASVLIVQALFFADGGILALGCNIFNLGFFPAFIAYPFIYRPLVERNPTRGMIMAASILAAVVGLQMGAFGVVLETTLSGISSLPFSTFVLLMQPIHLAIGIVEGIVTALVILFISQLRPDIVGLGGAPLSGGGIPVRKVVVIFLVVSLLTGGVISWFASEQPDGLEWSIARVTGKEEVESEGGVYQLFAEVQKRISFLPDYTFPKPENPVPEGSAGADGSKLGTSVSGVVGGLMTLVLVGGIGYLLKPRREG
ncbi:MAG: energy-coupling factor ABC transporter permease [Desulfuromonadia bacterium]